MGTDPPEPAGDAAPVAPRPAPAIDPFERLRRDATPLDQKVNTTVLVALGAGLLIGTAEAALGYRLWPGALVALVAALLLTKAARCWIADPLHRLIRLLPSVTRDLERRPLSHLPAHRRDEVGKLAGLIRDLTGDRLTHRHESRQLRRTLDQRVQEATRRATSELKSQAFRDALTGAGNRRHLEEQLPRLIDAAKVSGTDLVVIALDLDHFKLVNDELGHAAGDDLLILLTDLLTGSVRDDDQVIRLGGDEFLVLQPGGDVEQAQLLADRVCRLYRQQTRRVAASLKGTGVPSLSVGIAGLHMDGLHTGPALLHKADQRIYAAKRAGRGRTASPLGVREAA